MKPPGVCERMWSVNLDALFSGEYQTQGGHSSRPSQYLRSLMTCTEVPWERLWEVKEHPGAPERTLGVSWSTRDRRWQVWKHLESEKRSFGKTTSSRGTLPVCLEIIPTTYHSMIFKTDGFILYSHLCIYIATRLHTVYLDWLGPVLENTIWGMFENDDRMNSEIHCQAMLEPVWR
jgi:hypothetical protein